MSSAGSKPTSETRSITEVIIRAVATHIFALASYGNLGSLLKLPKNLHAGYVAVFLLYPTIIVGQLVYGAWAAVIYETSQYRAHRREDIMTDLCFEIQGVMGVNALPNSGVSLDHGMDDESPVPLFKAGYRSVQRATYKVSWKWFGRVILSVAGVVQAIGTVVLFIRRNDRTEWDQLMIDNFNGVAAIGSAVSGSVAIIILLMRLNWKVVSPIQLESHGYPRLTAMGIQLALSFISLGWMRGYLFWYFLSVPCMFLAQGNPFQTVVIVFLLFIFRREIFKRIGVSFIVVQSFVLCLVMLIMASDVVICIVESILQLRGLENGGWKDPLSDKLLVI